MVAEASLQCRFKSCTHGAACSLLHEVCLSMALQSLGCLTFSPARETQLEGSPGKRSQQRPWRGNSEMLQEHEKHGVRLKLILDRMGRGVCVSEEGEEQLNIRQGVTNEYGSP